ncbi:MAG: hypothetical protein ACOH2S_14270 [Janthinobacterium svalbardensis]
MNLAIKSYLSSPAPEILTEQKNSLPSSPLQSASPDVHSNFSVNVTISSSARALYKLDEDRGRAAPLSENELRATYEKGQSDVYKFGQLLANGNYSKENLLPNSDDPDRLLSGQKSLDFAIGLSKLPPKVLPNPYEGFARNDLSAIVYEGSGNYTEAERYAAYAELGKQDEAYFSKLFSKITNGGDNREVFKGILDYFDGLPVIEKSAYQNGFRDSINGLYKEQIGLWGKMAPAEDSNQNHGNKSISPIFDNSQSSQKMLQAILQKAAGHPDEYS